MFDDNHLILFFGMERFFLAITIDMKSDEMEILFLLKWFSIGEYKSLLLYIILPCFK